MNCVNAVIWIGLMSSGLLAEQSKRSHLNTVNSVNHELELEFNYMDVNNNSLIELDEFDAVINVQDADKNGCVSLNEFIRYHYGNELKQAWNLFNHYDHDQDGCLELYDMIDEYSEIDVNPKDGEVTLNELEEYYDKLFKQIGMIPQA
ncbi:uncharacterized protein LOC132728450 [Ruditapes philippinarum]|uniref:uncharacterized protein LOC132728450 n=1 Tax=Ruditapes philippinarum TaxID=129788 RepID=UPI00295BAC9C|nr:uncharacterized protein LOC132728450 [Ruditapes philippinarum]